MRKKIFVRTLGIVTMILAITIFVYFGQIYYFRVTNHNAIRIEGFHLEPKDSLDTVFLGSSDVYAGYAPARAYKQTKMTGFNYAISSNLGVFLKYELDDILERQKPKVLVVEVNGLTYDNNRLFGVKDNLAVIDAMPPYSKARKDMIDNSIKKDKMQAKIPFTRHHLRLNLSFIDMISMKTRGSLLFKGAFVHKYQVKKPKEWDNSKCISRNYPLNPVARRTCLAFMRKCKKSGVEHIVFVKFPHIVHNKYSCKRSRRYNEIRKLAEENGIDYVDLDIKRKEMGLDYNKDFRDAEHLSFSGQRKLTDYFSKYILDKYNIKPTNQTASNTKNWEKSAEYDQYFYEYLTEERKKNPRILPYLSKTKKNTWPADYVVKISESYKENVSLIKSLDKIKHKDKKNK